MWQGISSSFSDVCDAIEVVYVDNFDGCKRVLLILNQRSDDAKNGKMKLFSSVFSFDFHKKQSSDCFCVNGSNQINLKLYGLSSITQLDRIALLTPDAAQ